MVPWPVEYGGRGANLLEWLIFEEEYYRAGAPKRINQNGIFLLGPTIMEYGTPEQKARFLPKMASSEEVWAQGWSEPNAGSDMANIQTTAILDGDAYVINGQKTWASRGAYADWLFGMFRTDPESERHRGLTFILVPLDLPGVTVRPIEQLDGLPGFAEVFLDDVRVPAIHRLGDEGQGLERRHGDGGLRARPDAAQPGALPGHGAPARRAVPGTRGRGRRRHARRRSCAAGSTPRPTRSRPIARSRACWPAARSAAEASLNKIFWSELDLRMHETRARDARGPRPRTPAAEAPAAPGTSAAGSTATCSRCRARSTPGTNEIQRNIIAERILGLPR